MVGVEPHAQEDLNIRAKRELNFGLVYVGFLIIVFGAMYYLNVSTDIDFARFEVLVSFADLWALGLMYVGLSFLRLKGLLGNSLGFFVVLVCVAITGVSVLNFDGQFRETVTEAFTINNPQGFTSSEISLNQTAGRLTIQGGLGGGNLMSGFFESNFSSVALQSNVVPQNNLLSIDISDTSFWEGLGNYFKNLTLQLNTGVSHDLTFTGDATRATFDLTDLRVSSLDGTLRATDALITLGANQPQSNITLDTTASSVTIIVPADAGLRVVSEDNISFVNLPEELTRISDTEYQTPIYESSVNKIELDISSQFSRISIVQNPL